MGSIPRSYNVVVRGALVRSCVPGDIINLTGVYLPQQGNNKKGMKDSLVHVSTSSLRYADFLGYLH